MKSKMKIETGKAVVVDWGRLCESCHVIEMELKGVALTLLSVRVLFIMHKRAVNKPTSSVYITAA